jgi:2-polyprenyl-3-methyl-5-hydroxy-6-metoxy-1,4-benzoquinol methylase
MSTGQTETPPNPARIFRTLTAFHETAALKAGIELELFTAIAEGHATVGDLAKRIGASEKGTRVLCDSLVVMEFLTKQDGRYGLAKDTAVFLDKRSPAYLGASSEFLVDESQRTGAYELLTEAVRKGGAAFSEEGTVSRENPVWLTFARTMAPIMAPAAQLLAGRVGGGSGPLSVLDIAAGHGLFGIAFASRNPQAIVTGVDWKFVLDAALENATAAGVIDRYRTIPGSAFEVDFGGPYDVTLLTNFLHHFDEDTCVGLLTRLHAATKPGGTVAILEFVPNADRVTPPWDALFALIMLASTGHGDAYTFDDLARMCRKAGYEDAELITLDPLPQRVVTARA